MLAHYCLQKFNILPSIYARMDSTEKAFILASIEEQVEAERKAEKEMKRKKR